MIWAIKHIFHIALMLSFMTSSVKLCFASSMFLNGENLSHFSVKQYKLSASGNNEPCHPDIKEGANKDCFKHCLEDSDMSVSKVAPRFSLSAIYYDSGPVQVVNDKRFFEATYYTLKSTGPPAFDYGQNSSSGTNSLLSLNMRLRL